MERWNGKVAVVTGATGAIGSKAAEKLLDHGMIVVGMAESMEELVKLSLKFCGKQANFYTRKVDLTKEHEIEAAFMIGPVDILVNCGEVVIKSSNWKQMWELGFSNATMEAIKIMKINNIEGHIVHINIHGHFAITNLTEQLRTEFDHSKTEIKITNISPALVESNGDVSAEVNKYLDNSPLLNPEHVAKAIIHSISRPPFLQIHDYIINPEGEQSLKVLFCRS